TATVGPPGSFADYICTGTNDGAQILAAIHSLPSIGGKVLVRNSVTAYDFSAVSDRLFATISNVTLEGETYGGVTFKANASLFPGGADVQGQFGILTIGITNTSLISSFTIKNIIFDCNSH